MLKKLSSEYQLYTCGNFFRIPRFEKKLLFSDSLLAKSWSENDKFHHPSHESGTGLGLNPGWYRETFEKCPLSKSALICPISASGSNFNPPEAD